MNNKYNLYKNLNNLVKVVQIKINNKNKILLIF